MNEYIVYLSDISEGVRILSKQARVTNVYPFISCAAVQTENEADIKSKFVKAIVRTARAKVCMDRVRRIVHSNRFSGGGEGVTVAIIDTGISPHIDFTIPWRLDAFVDLVNGETQPYDDNGHGTAVAGVLAGSGMLSGGRFAGIAPRARIISLKALGGDGEGSSIEILQAMQWIYTNKERYNIRVVCMSFGAEPLPRHDPLTAGVEALHYKGIAVVVSSGNSGPEAGTIKSPGTSPFAITVGGADIIEGEIAVAEYSSRGPAGGITKPDLIAPSTEIITTSIEDDYAPMSGTSIATPIIAGACALILSEHPTYQPDKLKEMLIKNSKKLECDKNVCGSGLVDLDGQ